MFYYNITSTVSIIVLTIVLFVRSKKLNWETTIYENIIIRICFSDLVFEIIQFINAWWIDGELNCLVFFPLSSFPLIYSILNSYLIYLFLSGIHFFKYHMYVGRKYQMFHFNLKKYSTQYRVL